MIFKLRQMLGRRLPETTELHLGYLPTLDAATLLVAQAQGYFEAEGLRVQLHKQSSRQKAQQRLAAGELHAAHLPGTVPLAAELGLDGPAQALRTAFVLCLGGSSFAVKPDVLGQIERYGSSSHPADLAAAMAEIVAQRRQDRQPRLRLAVPDRHGTGQYLLRHWLAEAGIDPISDVEFAALTPGRVLASLASERYDGAWLDEPYGSLAAADGIVQPLFSQHALWNHSLAAVLAVDERWAQRRPQRHQALLRALLRASHWVENNRVEAAQIIATALEVPESALSALSQGIATRAGQYVGDLRFASGAASFPWYSQAVWYLGQMIRWGDYGQVLDFKKTAQTVFQPTLYREAARQLQLPYPSIGYKNEGLHVQDWLLEEASEPILMGADGLFDGRIYKPRQTMKYLNGLKISHISAPLDAMWAIR